MRPIKVAIIGNPNSGKSTLFNALTGGKQIVGNWPGVTVERKSGYFIYAGKKVEIVDLPGVYTLTVVGKETSLDAQIACDSLFYDDFGLILNVIDANNIERNLYLTTQLLEMGKPVLIVANMEDVAEKHGKVINFSAFTQALNCPVLGFTATRKSKIPALKEAIVHSSAVLAKSPVMYPEPLQQGIAQLVQQIKPFVNGNECAATFFAMRLLEGADSLKDRMPSDVFACIREEVLALEEALPDEIDILIADARYTYAHQVTGKVMQKVKSNAETITQKIDKVVLHRVLGIPIFLAVMYAMFFFSINIAGAFQSFFDIAGSTIFIDGVEALFNRFQAPEIVTIIVAHGVGSGVTTVLTFIPVICGLFLFLSFLEGSGYMARASFVVDRCMRAIGLPGKSFVPLIVGFGCNVPAVMATRTLEQRRDRLMTLMMTPFMSCGARMAIYTVFVAAFFQGNGQNVVFFLYLTGIVMAVVTGLLLHKTILQGDSSQWVVELPTYHIPTLTSIWRQTWHRLAQFLFKAGKFIVPACLLLGVLNSITLTGQLQTKQPSGQDSILAVAAKSITPFFMPMGIQQENWPATVGLISGVLAKEVVVGTLNSLYTQLQGAGDADLDSFSLLDGLKQAVNSIPEEFAVLKESLLNPMTVSEGNQEGMTGTAMGVMSRYFDGAAGALAYLLFTLLYFPCVSVVAALIRESSIRWALFSVSWSTGLAYIVAVIFYQLATFARHPMSSVGWVIGLLLSILGTFWIIFKCAKKGKLVCNFAKNSKEKQYVVGGN